MPTPAHFTRQQRSRAGRRAAASPGRFTAPRGAAALAAAGLALLAGCASAPPAETPPTVLRAQRLIAAPDAPPVDDAVIVMQAGRIVAAGPRAAVSVPAGARELGCEAGVVTAGFQNSHVHFTGAAFAGAASKPADGLSTALGTMLLRWGVTTVLDASSDPRNTAALRQRITRGEVTGPRILTAGGGLFPHQGLPFYLGDLPAAVRDQLPQPATPQAAVGVVQFNVGAGADATKLFVATPQLGAPPKRMQPTIARAAADETHRLGKPVLAHPTDTEGLQQALAAGVDILTHTTPGVPEPWSPSLIGQLVAQKMALVPTLKLWGYEMVRHQVPVRVHEPFIASAQQQLKDFAAAGGQVLFGTDVGYMLDDDPREEYRLMAAAMTPAQVLASLTTAPAARWNETGRRGRVAAGQDADLVVLAADPLADATRLADVRCTVRGGAVAWRR